MSRDPYGYGAPASAGALVNAVLDVLKVEWADLLETGPGDVCIRVFLPMRTPESTYLVWRAIEDRRPAGVHVEIKWLTKAQMAKALLLEKNSDIEGL